MHHKAYELIKSFLERNETEALPIPVEYALINMLRGTGQAVELIREIAHTSLKQAYHTLAIMEARRYPLDLHRLLQEIYLVEDEREAQILAAGSDEATLEAHVALFFLLPTETESTQRRRRVIAMALTENFPERAAAFIGDFAPPYEIIGFWRSLRRRLMLRLKSQSPDLAMALLDRPEDAHYWLWEALTTSGTDTGVISRLISRTLRVGLPMTLPLSEAINLADAFVQKDIEGRVDMLCLLAVPGSLPVDDRPALLKRLIEVGHSLPEADQACLVDTIRKGGVTYLKTVHRREVLKRLAHFARHCHPEIRREIRILRAIALLEHLSPSRLAQAHTWVQAYDRRFGKRLQAIQREREELQGQILIFLRALAQQRGAEAGVDK